jgi:hypothetical protein
MNKKLLVMAVAFIAVAMLATPMVGTAEACRWRRRPQPFEATFQLRNPASEPYAGGFTPPTTEHFGPTDSAWVNPFLNPDGYKYMLSKGLVAWGTIDCGALGKGKMTLTQKWWFNNFETLLGVTMVSYLLEFDGEYGDYEGSISAIFLSKTDSTNPTLFITEGNGIFFKGTGDFEGVKIIANENHSIDVTQFPLIINGEFTGRIWGLP